MKKSKNNETNWIIIITILSFVISFIFSLISELVIPNTFIAINIFLILLFIILGILFDVIGVAVTTADDKMFHSMATKKVKGAKKAIKFIKNKSKVSSFCNDVIGDICGVISGSCGITVSLKIANLLGFNALIVSLITTSIISALTIGGKAYMKKVALNNNNKIIYSVVKIITIFDKE